MVDRPILFSAPMVLALLAGTKTQTRRIVHEVVDFISHEAVDDLQVQGYGIYPNGEVLNAARVRFTVGDRLWVREAWRCNGWASDLATIFYRASEGGGYTAMCEQYPVTGRRPLRVTGTWRPSIHIPRWASRLTLTVTCVRVQRLQDISPEDARDEGVERRSRKVRQINLFGASAEERARQYLDACVWEYEELWVKINGAGAWDANPWVVAISFTVARRNIDGVAPC